MSGKSTTVPADKNTTQEPNSTTVNTTNSTGTPANPADTTQAKDSTSNIPGILEEGLSDKDPAASPAAVINTDPPADGAPVVPPAIEPYELELSDESPLTDAEFDEVVQEAERLKLNKEDAEKLIAMREYSHKASHEVFQEAAKAKVEGMIKEYREDATLHTTESKLSLREAIKTFGADPSFKEMFKDPSMNFNIPLAKFLITVGEKIRATSNTVPLAKGNSFEAESKDPIVKAANNFYKNM